LLSSAEEATIRISELSRRSGVPVPTIKFYIREELLPRGESTAPNQARYGEAHLHRLTLIGALQQAGLSLAVIKQSLHAMDTMGDDSPDFMRIAVGSLQPFVRAADDDLDPAVRPRPRNTPSRMGYAGSTSRVTCGRHRSSTARANCRLRPELGHGSGRVRSRPSPSTTWGRSCSRQDVLHLAC
jgi:DNA-binding transcriptional MerR regulator